MALAAACGCSRQQGDRHSSAAEISPVDSQTTAFARAMADAGGADDRSRDSAQPEDSSGTTGASSSSSGTDVDDATLASKVDAALAGDSDLKTMNIGVKVYKGEVMLEGIVNNQTQIDRAVKLTRGVDGVTTIRNGITIRR